ncbi:MAG: nitrilase-related carbon-nitrogen hydrolase [Caldilineaceae bacterium]
MAEDGSSDKAWNMTLVYDPAGELIASYKKIHLFDIDITGKVVANESSRYDAGTEMVAFESEHGVMGRTIRYDIRFELYRALTLAGAWVIFQPSAFTLYTGKDHWGAAHLLSGPSRTRSTWSRRRRSACTRAIRYCFGNAMIVDPWGTAVARARTRVRHHRDRLRGPGQGTPGCCR